MIIYIKSKLPVYTANCISKAELEIDLYTEQYYVIIFIICVYLLFSIRLYSPF